MAKLKQSKKMKPTFVIKEVLMAILALLCSAGLVLEHLEHLAESQLYALEAFEIVVGALFLLEFGLEFYFAKDRKKYWRHHWYFLIAAVPLPTQTFELLRGVRALRILRLLKIFAHLRYEQAEWNSR